MKNNYNIKTNIPELSSEQINKHQDFDALFAKFEQTSDSTATKETTIEPQPKFSPWVLKSITGGLVTVAAAILIVLMIRQTSGELIVPQNQMNEVLALQAPLSDFQKSFDKMQVEDAQKGATLEHTSGTKIIVPASAFVNEKGEKVKGKVDIEYREFNDHVDMFLAGVPKEQDKHQNLQSVGMMEIKGSQDGKPVYLGTDKTLAIELESRILADLPTSDLDVFVFSKQTDAWEYKADDIVTASNKAINTTTTKPASLEKIQAQAEAKLATSKPKQPIEPKQVPENMQIFDFDINKEAFPEIAHFDQNIDFVIAKKDVANDPFSKEWGDMKIKNLGNDRVQITLTRQDDNGTEEVLNLNALPLLVQTAATKARYEKLLASYNDKLEQWNESVAQEVIALQANPNTPKYRNIVNSFKIDRFGLWNCGKDIELKEDLQIAANLVDMQGNPIQTEQLFITNTQNQLYYFANKNQLKLDTKAESKIWALTSNNELLVANSKTPNPNKENEYTFEFEPVGTVNSEEDIREVLTF